MAVSRNSPGISLPVNPPLVKSLPSWVHQSVNPDTCLCPFSNLFRKIVTLSCCLCSVRRLEWLIDVRPLRVLGNWRRLVDIHIIQHVFQIIPRFAFIHFILLNDDFPILCLVQSRLHTSQRPGPVRYIDQRRCDVRSDLAQSHQALYRRAESLIDELEYVSAVFCRQCRLYRGSKVVALMWEV